MKKLMSSAGACAMLSLCLSAPVFAADGPGGFDIKALIPLVLFGAVFYFLLFRPQQKKAKDQQTMIAALRRGDRVVTQGGLFGVVSKLDNDGEITVEFAPDVQIKVLRAAVTAVVSKTEPVTLPAEDAGEAKSRVVKKPAAKTAKIKSDSKK